jgi:imidazole glycerol-phosphate synthase subunit HisH
MRVTLIDSPYANVANIARALEHAGANLSITADPSRIELASKLVLPGVGSFAAAMEWLDSSAIAAALRGAVSRGAALLGVCVGHQLLFDSSDEMGQTSGLQLLRGRVTRFETSLPVPQIGWNPTRIEPDPLFSGVDAGSSFYFVHSYRATGLMPGTAIATASYGEEFVAAARSGRVCGVQFHPEKSSTAGLRVLRNFVEAV